MVTCDTRVLLSPPANRHDSSLSLNYPAIHASSTTPGLYQLCYSQEVAAVADSLSTSQICHTLTVCQLLNPNVISPHLATYRNDSGEFREFSRTRKRRIYHHHRSSVSFHGDSNNPPLFPSSFISQLSVTGDSLNVSSAITTSHRPLSRPADNNKNVFFRRGEPFSSSDGLFTAATPVGNTQSSLLGVHNSSLCMHGSDGRDMNTVYTILENRCEIVSVMHPRISHSSLTKNR